MGARTSVRKVDRTGIWFERPTETPVNVFFDGARVWSAVPQRDGHGSRDGWVVTWPRLLAAQLDGYAEVVIRPMDSSTELFRDEIRFGPAAQRLVVRDRTGAPGVVDKTGRVGRLFAAADDEAKSALLIEVERALVVLNEVVGVPGFLAFGALLGAVRDGHLIGHDNDVDVSYLARGSHPVDVIVESFQVERMFQGEGWSTMRMSGADFKLIVPWRGGGTIGIDVFTAFYNDGWLYVMPTVRGRVPPGDLLPLTTVELEGRPVSAPRNPEALLRATYGAGWRVPDPSFKYRPDRGLQRRLSGWMRGERHEIRHWAEFYRGRSAAVVPEEPSAFARWTLAREGAPRRILELGCGTGRDALWFARSRCRVRAVDFVGTAAAAVDRRARTDGLPLRAARMNIADLRDSLTYGAAVAHGFKPQVVYARFLLDAIRPAARGNVWRLARQALRATGGRLYLEFRVAPTARYLAGRHWRTFTDPATVVRELEPYGFEIEHTEQAHGLAVLSDEDPLVGRVVGRMRRE